jgi:hypothetical protein
MLLNSTTSYRPESQVCLLPVCCTLSVVLGTLKLVREPVVIQGKEWNIKSFPNTESKTEICLTDQPCCDTGVNKF